MKGAWIGKPTAANSKRRRFFQLSEDGSTLRWAWNKYIIMYYVEVCPVSLTCSGRVKPLSLTRPLMVLAYVVGDCST